MKNNENVNIGNNSTRVVGNHQRESTGQSRLITIGTNRSTQVGRIDSTIAGEMHSVMVWPPGEGGLDDATSWTMQKDKITFSTPGGAKITLEGGSIKIEAAEMIYAFAKSSCTLWSTGPTTIGGIGGLTLGSTAGDVVVKGGPLVKINT